jgi:hypothetical protein
MIKVSDREKVSRLRLDASQNQAGALFPSVPHSFYQRR